MRDLSRPKKYEEDYEECQRVFVYGTLQSFGSNNRILYGSELLGVSTTTKEYVLLDCGFPGAFEKELIPEVGPAKVCGEAWLLADPIVLRRMDALESEGFFYHRKLEEIEGFGQCWMYTLQDRDISGMFRYICNTNEEGHYKWRM